MASFSPTMRAAMSSFITPHLLTQASDRRPFHFLSCAIPLPRVCASLAAQPFCFSVSRRGNLRLPTDSIFFSRSQTMDVVLTFCSIRLSLRLIFFSPDEVMSGRGRVNPEDRVEYEYEFVDGKRKAPRVVILGGGSPAGGPPAGGPPQTQRHNSRGALLASSFSTKQTVACRLFTRVAFFFPVSAGFFYSLPRVASRRWSTPHATRFYPDFVALSPLPRYYLPLVCATGHLFRCCWLVRWLRLLLWCSSLSLPA